MSPFLFHFRFSERKTMSIIPVCDHCHTECGGHCVPSHAEPKTFGRYMACHKCDNPILSEKNGFTGRNNEVICQRCGLEEILTPREWSTMFSIMSGVPAITTPDQCPSITPFPPDENMNYVVEFSSPAGEKFCVTRKNTSTS